jgi:hypothetical protein
MCSELDARSPSSAGVAVQFSAVEKASTGAAFSQAALFFAIGTPLPRSCRSLLLLGAARLPGVVDCSGKFQELGMRNEHSPANPPNADLLRRDQGVQRPFRQTD